MVFTCEYCNYGFDTLRGLKLHQSRYCRNNQEIIKRTYANDLVNDDVNANKSVQIETTKILRCEEINVYEEQNILPNLPDFELVKQQYASSINVRRKKLYAISSLLTSKLFSGGKTSSSSLQEKLREHLLMNSLHGWSTLTRKASTKQLL